MRAHALVGVVGHVDEAGALRRGRGTGLLAQLAARLGVGRPQRRVDRDEAVAEPRRPAGRGRGRAAHEQARPLRARRPRRDPDPAAPVLERLARPGRPQHGDALLDQGGPLVHAPVEHRHLLGAVAGAEHEVDAAAAGEVEHRQVLGQADRVVQRHDQRRHEDAQRAGPAGDRRRHHQRAGAVAVVGPVVLGQRRHQEAVLLGPGALVERRPVQRLGRRAERRCPQVVAQRQERRDVVPHPGPPR